MIIKKIKRDSGGWPGPMAFADFFLWFAFIRSVVAATNAYPQAIVCHFWGLANASKYARETLVKHHHFWYDSRC